LRGATAAINDFTRIADRLADIAEKEGRVLTRTEQLNVAIEALGGQYVLLAGAVAAFTAAAGLSLKVFADDEQAIFRTTVVLKNMRSSLPIEELQQFAQELQKTIAVDDEAVVALGGILARFGVAGKEIPATLKSIVDASEATGISLEQLGETVGRAALGQTRGLRELGIEFTATGNRAKDLARIRAELDRRFAGAGEARAGTLTGALERFSQTFQNLLSAIGERLTPATIKMADAMAAFTNVLIGLQEQHGLISESLISGFFGVSPAAQQVIGLSRRQPNQAENIGSGKAAPASEATLGKVAENTEKTANALIRQIAGGGALSAGALNFRGINAALRSAR
jgi:hypothetical protein